MIRHRTLHPALIAALALVVTACGGDDSNDAVSDADSAVTTTTVAQTTTSEPASPDTTDEAGDEAVEGDGMESAAPTVDFEAALASDGSVELTILTTSFELVGQDAEPTGSAPQAGHFHVVVGGEPTIVYTGTTTLSLPPGENEVTVELHTADHAPILVDGEVVHVTKMVHVPETPGEDLHTHDD